MPFCINCGKEYDEGAMFCTSCGAAVNSSIVTQNKQPYNAESLGTDSVKSFIDARNSHIEELTKMCDYFSPYKDKYNRLYFLINTLSHGYTLVPALIIGIFISSTIGIGMAYPQLIKLIETGEISEIGILGFFIYAIGIALIFLFIFGTINRNIKRKKNKKECQMLFDELWKYYISYGPCVLGFEYTFPEMLQEIKNIVLSGRVNNTKEAINILLSDRQKQRLIKYITAEIDKIRQGR